MNERRERGNTIRSPPPCWGGVPAGEKMGTRRPTCVRQKEALTPAVVLKGGPSTDETAHISGKSRYNRQHYLQHVHGCYDANFRQRVSLCCSEHFKLQNRDPQRVHVYSPW